MSPASETTTIRPWELNYDRYTEEQYDRDIAAVIPAHRELHARIAKLLAEHFDPLNPYEVLDLGTGTGITAAVVRDTLPHCRIDAVDFSQTMLSHAQRKLGDENTRFIEADYSMHSFLKQYDIVSSVIGLHHQNDEGKRRLFQTIYDHLSPGGRFILGDLMTFRDQYEAALNDARHFHHLVEGAPNERALREWAHHHRFLNVLSPMEDQIEWLSETGFAVEKLLQHYNTVLLSCTKCS